MCLLVLSIFFFLHSCEHFLEFHFDFSTVFLDVSLFIAFFFFKWLLRYCYTHNLSQSAGIILSVQVKHSNLPSVYVLLSSLVCKIIVFNNPLHTFRTTLDSTTNFASTIKHNLANSRVEVRSYHTIKDIFLLTVFSSFLIFQVSFFHHFLSV